MVAALATFAVAAAAAALAGTSDAQLSAASSSSGSGLSELCSQTELVALGSILKNTSRKIQCQEDLKITEMLRPPNYDFSILCDKVACTAALQILYNTLPHCRYQDWDPQDQSSRVLKFCGITPVNATEADKLKTGTLPGATTTGTPTPTPAVSWNSQGSTTSFAPIGTTTSAPVAATPTPSPASSAPSLAAPLLALATTVLAAATMFA